MRLGPSSARSSCSEPLVKLTLGGVTFFFPLPRVALDTHGSFFSGWCERAVMTHFLSAVIAAMNALAGFGSSQHLGSPSRPQRVATRTLADKIERMCHRLSALADPGLARRPAPGLSEMQEAQATTRTTASADDVAPDPPKRWWPPASADDDPGTPCVGPATRVDTSETQRVVPHGLVGSLPAKQFALGARRGSLR